jgi:pimeloyl-ACP methyl ester carboxylesterase
MTAPRSRPRGRTGTFAPWPLALAALLVAAARARAAGGTPPAFHVEPDTLRADESGIWHAGLVIENKADYGLYADSLVMEWRSDDPDSTPGPRSGSTPLMGLVRVIAAASSGETTGMQWSAPADFERGTIVFQLVTHDGQKNVYHSSARVAVTGSWLYDMFPRELIKQGSQTVDVVVMPADSTARPAAGLLFVPSADMSARGSMRALAPYRSRGMTVALVSLPGVGRSSGRPDRAGPASVAAVDAALARLARDTSVDPKRIAVWGVNEGATAALLAAVKHPELQGVVAQDAAYDAWAAYRALPAAERGTYAREAGSDSAGWRARSPLLVAGKIPAPVLVLQTNEPGAPDSTSAAAFAHARGDQQLFIEARIGAQGSKPFMRRDALRVAQDFLARRLRHP